MGPCYESPSVLVSYIGAPDFWKLPHGRYRDKPSKGFLCMYVPQDFRSLALVSAYSGQAPQMSVKIQEPSVDASVPRLCYSNSARHGRPQP